jgi:alkylmercury lyase
MSDDQPIESLADQSIDHTEQLAGEIIGAMPSLDPTEQRIGLTLLRLLAEGEPVNVNRLARALDLPHDQVDKTLEEWWGIYLDEQRRVVGFNGLTPLEMGNHRLHIDGRTLSAWCAWDTLFLPELLDRTARITSRDPLTGAEISLTVTPKGPVDVTPKEAVVSMLALEEGAKADVIKSFCHYVHFFATPDDAAAWTAEHPGTYTLSIADAYDLGRTLNHTVFGVALDRSPAAA